MANKTTIRKFFLAIRHDDRGLVKAMLMQDPALVNACALSPPKKDDGQSPLQVALKTAKPSIAHVLLDHGANVNFMETSQINSWNAPVLHDSLRGVVSLAGWRTTDIEPGFPTHFALFERLLEMGADPNGIDSYGNTCFDRVVLDASRKSDDADRWAGATGEDLQRVIDALVRRGGDPRRPGQRGEIAADWAQGKPVGRLLERWATPPS